MTSQSASSIPCDAVGLQEDFSDVITNLSALESYSFQKAHIIQDYKDSLYERVDKLERMVDKIIDKLVALNYKDADLSIDEIYGDWA